MGRRLVLRFWRAENFAGPMLRFLIVCEDEGIELVGCPLYVREWIFRERAEGTQLENA